MRREMYVSVHCGILCLLVFMSVSSGGKVNFDMGLFDIPLCHCPDMSSCIPRKTPEKHFSVKKEVIMISQGSESWKDWQWDVIGTVINNGSVNKDLMCYTHSKKKDYGFIVRPDNFTSLLAKSDGGEYTWIIDVVQKVHHNFVDYLALDLLDVFNDHTVNVTQLRHFVHRIKYSLISLTRGAKLMCLLPWKPPGINGDYTLTKIMVDNCDKFMTEPRSYLTIDMHCRASATVPFTKLILGINEFVARGVPVEKFYLGVPWHGYDYVCHHFNQKLNICHLSATNMTDQENKCPYNEVRTQKRLGQMINSWPEHIQQSAKHQWDRFNMAPYYLHNETDPSTGLSVTHQLWFEDVHSLSLKYHFVSELEMAGVAIWSVDDLNYKSKDPTTQVFDHSMWTLLRDAMFKPKDSFMNNQFNSFPSKMAGVGVGCMLLGTVLGFAIGVIVCRREGKLRPPFMKDHSPQQEYTDDDPNL